VQKQSVGLRRGGGAKSSHGKNDSRVEECVMHDNTLFWGLLIASLTNVLCVCSYLGGIWSLAAG
jgi:hypothetical protein